MKIQRSDLNPKTWNKMTEEIFSSVPMDLFESVGDNQYLAFHYNYDEIRGEILDIQNLKVVSSIDIKLYQKQPHTDRKYYSVGFFQFPLDTQNTLFYQFLKYYFVFLKPKETKDEAKKKLMDFFLSAKAKDLESIAFRRENTVYNNVFKVYGRDTFVSAVNRFVLAQGDVANCVLAITDAIDYHCKGIKNKSLYGSLIEKVVMAIPSTEGGLVPDKIDRLRYLYVGENSVLEKDNKELNEAKEMYRNGDDAGEILAQTGWHFSKKDQKWKKRVSDIESSIQELAPNSVFMKYGSKFSAKSNDAYRYLTAGAKYVDDDGLTLLLKQGWDMYLSDVFTHPTLYKHYPSLFKMPIFYATNSKPMGNENNSYSFYYNPKEKYLCIVGNPAHWDFKNVILHEIQHAIQEIENFGTGGSPSLSRLIQAIGGENVKNYYFVRKNITEKYKLGVNQNGRYSYENFSKAFSTWKWCQDVTENKYYSDCDDIIENIVEYYIQDNAVVNDLIKKYVDGEIHQSLQTLLKYRKKHIEVRASLMGQGFTANDVDRLIHRSYEALLGEVEARDVQNTQLMEEDLQGYLLPLTSEAILEKDINVFFDKTSSSPIIPTVIKGAVETTLEDKYIIHLFPNFSSRPILHEIGHILGDIIGRDIIAKRIYDSFGDQSIIDLGGTDEIFCELFLCYLSSQPFPSRVINDLRKGRVENDKFEYDKNALTIFADEFNAIFHPTQDDEQNRAFMSRILFVAKMNELVNNTGTETKQEEQEPTPTPSPIPEKPKEADIDTEDMSVVDWVDWVDSDLVIHYDGDTQLQLLSIEPFDDKDMFSSNWVSIVNFEEYFDGKRFSKEAIRGYVISLLKQAMLDTIRKESATSTTLKYLIYLKPKNTEPTPTTPTKKGKEEKKELVQKIEWVDMGSGDSDLVLYYNNGDSLHLMQIQTNTDYQPPRDFIDSVWLKEGLLDAFSNEGRYSKQLIKDYIVSLLETSRLATIQKEDVKSTTLSSLYLFNEEQKTEEKKGDKAYYITLNIS